LYGKVLWITPLKNGYTMMTDEQIANAQQMHNTGISYRKIGNALGVDHSTVRRNLDPTARERARAYDAAYHKAHKKEVAAYQKAHLSERAAHNAGRRVLKAGTLIRATVNQLAEIAEIYRHAKEDPKVRCYLCGKLIPKGHRHVDHIMPLSKGGKHKPSNLAVACDTCNLSKYNKLPNEVGILL